ncbi:unnamed protein product, partial [Oppiella nova]
MSPVGVPGLPADPIARLQSHCHRMVGFTGVNVADRRRQRTATNRKYRSL